MPTIIREFKLASVAAFFAMVALTGCTTVHPPAGVNQESAQAETVEVFLIRHPCHTAIVIPDRDGIYTEWTYGDRIFVSRTGFARQVRGVMLVPVGNFGRFSAGALKRTNYVASMEAISFRARRDKVEQLRKRLEMEYEAGEKLGNTNPYRAASPKYSLWWYNCQNWVAEQVRELDASVSKFRLAPRWGAWKVQSPKSRVQSPRPVQTRSAECEKVENRK